MATKVELQKKLGKTQTRLNETEAELKRVKYMFSVTLGAMKITQTDLERKVAFKPEDYDETGDEQVERFERGMDLAIDRLDTLRSTLKEGKLPDFKELFWTLGTGA